MGLAVVVAHFRIDENLSTFLADVGIMDEETSTSHLVFLKSIRDGNLILGDEPYITIDATMIGKVEGHLFLARRVCFVVAVVCADGNDDIIAYGTI